MSPRLSVIIATQRRPAPLARAMRSVAAQAGVDLSTLELVVVDNDLVDSARAVVGAEAASAPFPVVYVHEPRPGVSTARNAALTVARGELIAFLDDDQEAFPDWLAELVSAQAAYAADVVFGPVVASLPPGVTRHRAYFDRFFSHPGPEIAGLSERAYGAGVCLIVRASLPDPHRPFASARNFSGGEDDLLFAEMRARGARFAWNPKAAVWEHAAPERISLGYAMRRTFVYGQGGTNGELIKIPPNRVRAARSMIVGAAQAVVFGGAAALLWLARAPRRAFVLDRAVQGLGKVFWGRRFRLQFYGLRPAERAGRSLRRAERADPDISL